MFDFLDEKIPEVYDAIAEEIVKYLGSGFTIEMRHHDPELGTIIDIVSKSRTAFYVNNKDGGVVKVFHGPSDEIKIAIEDDVIEIKYWSYHKSGGGTHRGMQDNPPRYRGKWHFADPKFNLRTIKRDLGRSMRG